MERSAMTVHRLMGISFSSESLIQKIFASLAQPFAYFAVKKKVTVHTFFLIWSF